MAMVSFFLPVTIFADDDETFATSPHSRRFAALAKLKAGDRGAPQCHRAAASPQQLHGTEY
jgi:hypothetical protein